MGGDEEIERTDRAPLPFQLGPELAVGYVGWRRIGENLHAGEYSLHLLGQFGGILFLRAKPDLGSNNHARRDSRLAKLSNALRDDPARISHQVRDGVRIEQILPHRSKGSAGGSETGGNFSRMGFNVLSKPRRECGRAGSMMSDFPLRRMTASVPGNSNSRGMRTAWLRPLRNSR